MTQMNLSTKQTHRLGEQTGGCRVVGEGQSGRRVQQMLLHVEQINSKVPQHHTKEPYSISCDKPS